MGNKAHAEAKKAMKRTHMQLGDVNAAIEEERKIKNEVMEQYGLTERKANAMGGQRQVEQELIDSREQVSDIVGNNTGLANAKRKLENDIHQMQADLDNMLASCKNSEEKAKKAMVDAGRLADELRAEQDHAASQERAARSTEVSLSEMQKKAEEASFAMARGAAQIPAKLESRSRDIEQELNRTIQMTDEVHKSITKGERRVKELLFQQEEYRKTQQDFEEAEERSKICESNITKYRTARGASM